MIRRPFIFIILLPLLITCSRGNGKKMTGQEIRETREALVGVNRMMVKKDKERIMEYLRANDLDLSESGSGLWYGIKEQGSGLAAKEGRLVTMEYDVSLLDGTKCYSSDSSGYKQFRVGKSDIESGLDEGVRMLNGGGEALFVLPPHLAHGLTGDGDKIPARAIIIYHVKLVKVE